MYKQRPLETLLNQRCAVDRWTDAHNGQSAIVAETTRYHNLISVDRITSHALPLNYVNFHLSILSLLYQTFSRKSLTSPYCDIVTTFQTSLLPRSQLYQRETGFELRHRCPGNGHILSTRTEIRLGSGLTTLVTPGPAAMPCPVPRFLQRHTTPRSSPFHIPRYPVRQLS
ncbi:hypothetical protein J6590_069328 [Homalodisca vitripennis]|nr:hypothetical protein J6590_069328 [Homalodisca vitripennis]